jgi:hypothetical protein
MFEIGENEVDHWQMGVGLFHITRAPLETSLHQDRLTTGAFMSHLEGHETLPHDPARRSAFQCHRIRTRPWPPRTACILKMRDLIPRESFRPLLEEPKPLEGLR